MRKTRTSISRSSSAESLAAILILIALAGCGRVGFEDAAGDAVTASTEPWSTPRAVDPTDLGTASRGGPSIAADELELYFNERDSTPDPREPEISADGHHLYFSDASTGGALKIMSRCATN